MRTSLVPIQQIDGWLSWYEILMPDSAVLYVNWFETERVNERSKESEKFAAIQQNCKKNQSTNVAL